jgi:uncharacterized protein (DUF2147 family)
MTKFLATAIFVFLCAGAAFAADPVEGFWLSVNDKTGEVQSGWEVYQSNGALVGKMISAVGWTETDKAARCRESYPGFPIAGKVNLLPVLGTPWIFGLRMEIPGRWTNGSVINPADGKVYGCSLIHHTADGKRFPQETLEMRGQLLVFSGSQYWRRATREEADAVR